MTYKITVNNQTRTVNKKDILAFLSSEKKALLEVWFPGQIVTEYLISSKDATLDGIRGTFKES